MIINSKISLNTEAKDRSRIARSLTTNADRQSTLTGFYNINLGKEFFRNTLLRKVFLNLESSDSKYYLDKKWLYLVMKPMLLGENQDDPRNQDYFNTFYEKVNQPYSLYPFGDLVDKLSIIFHNFFKDLTFEDVVKNNPINLRIVERGGLEPIAFSYITKLFNLFEAKLLNNKKLFKDIVKDVLKNAVENKLRNLDADFDWSNYDNLRQWVENFNYKSTLSTDGTNSFDQVINAFFNETANPEERFISEEGLISNYLEPYFNLDRNSDREVTNLQQLFLYYLFNDLLINKIRNTAKQVVSLHFAKSLVTNITNNPQAINIDLLELILPGIKSTIKKFNFYWKTDITTSGLTMGQNGKTLLLAPVQNDNDNYHKLEFVFKFLLDTGFDSLNVTKPHNIFFIKARKAVPIIEKAETFVNEFKNQIEWNQGFQGSSWWTEKDIVDWIDSVKQYQDISDYYQEAREKALDSETNEELLNLKPREKVLSESEWQNFIANFPEFIKLKNKIIKLAENTNYQLKIEPVVKFLFNPQNLLGDIEVYLKLEQTPKDNLQSLAIADPVKLILVKPASKILSMIDFIKNSLSQKFPSGLNFEPWKDQGKSFILNEFLDKDGNPVKNLKEKKDLVKRSNWIDIKSYLQPLINDINNYRNDFTIEGPDGDDNQGIIIKNLENEPEYGLTFSVNDNAMNKEISQSVTKKLASMKVVGNLKKGRYKGTSGEYSIFLKKLQNQAVPLHPSIQATPQVDKNVSADFTFKIFNKETISFNEKLTFADIQEEFSSRGYFGKDITKIKVAWKIEDEQYKVYIPISNRIIYHSFFTGEEVVIKNANTFLLFLNFDGVSAEDIEEGYQNIIKNKITGNKKGNKNLMTQIDNIFKTLKYLESTEWRNDVSKLEYNAVVEKVLQLIINFKVSDAVMKQLKSIYNNKVPKKIVDKLQYLEYIRTFDKILKEKDSFTGNKLKQILEDDKLVNFLKDHEVEKTKDFIFNFLKIADKDTTKYAYLGTAIGLGLTGFLAGATSIRWMKINYKTEQATFTFKKNRYISFVSLGVAILSICGSLVLIFLFFLNKGGF